MGIAAGYAGIITFCSYMGHNFQECCSYSGDFIPGPGTIAGLIVGGLICNGIQVDIDGAYEGDDVISGF